MTKFVNRAKVYTATTGTGDVTLGSAVIGHQTFDSAGVLNSDIVRYAIEDGTDWEIGIGTYTTVGSVLTRSVTESSNAGTPISLTGNAIVYVTASSADLLQPQDIGITVQGYSAALQGTTASYTTALNSKLNGIEAGATADQTATEIKTAYESNADTNAYSDTEKSKLAAIESGATADQTAAEILTAIKTVDGTGTGLDADLLDGQHGTYYTGYTDTAIANLVATAPTTLDTLNELAAALGNDPNFATTVSTNIGTKAPINNATFTGTTVVPTADINGGNIDGTVIGVATPAAITGTDITATTGFIGPLTGSVTGDLTGDSAGTHTGAVVGSVTGDVTSTGTSSFADVTISGSLDMSAGTSATVTGLSAPVNATDAATKTYVDSADALKLNLTGGTMSGAVAMGNNKITGLGTPTATTDAVTKDYVDTASANSAAFSLNAAIIYSIALG